MKRNEDGLPARFKGRLIALGNFQTDKLDFVEVYVPVACIETLRILFFIAKLHGCDVHQIDVVGAFLYAALSESEDI